MALAPALTLARCVARLDAWEEVHRAAAEACRARDTPLASHTGEREALHPAAAIEPADVVHV